MVKITINANKRDVILTYAYGQLFPKLEGKLVSVEVGGKELVKLVEKQEIPLFIIDASTSIVWHGKHAGRIVKELRELFDA